MVDRFMEGRRCYVVFDESQRLKSPQAKRTQAAARIGARARFRRLLSGTPILRGLEDLYTQYDIVKPGVTGFSNFFAYRAYYCCLERVWGASSPHAMRVVGYQNEDRLTERVRGHSISIPAREFMTSPDPIISRVRLDMNRDQRRAYSTMTEHLVAMIDSGDVTAQNALVQMAKLLQIASGFLYDEDGGTTVLSHGKTDAVMELLDQLDEPVIVWVPYIAQQEMLVQALAEYNEALVEQARMPRPVFQYGDSSTIANWKNERDGILIANQAAGAGTGLNLQHAAAAIYMSNIFRSEARWQSLKRIDRIGQTRQVRIWDIMTANTVDYAVSEALSSREDLSNRTLSQLRSMIA